METAYRLQTEAPGVFDVRKEIRPSSGGRPSTHALVATKLTRAAYLGYVGVYCDPASNTASAPAETASYGKQFQWIGAGETPPRVWWVTPDAGTCL